MWWLACTLGPQPGPSPDHQLVVDVDCPNDTPDADVWVDSVEELLEASGRIGLNPGRYVVDYTLQDGDQLVGACAEYSELVGELSVLDGTIEHLTLVGQGSVQGPLVATDVVFDCGEGCLHVDGPTELERVRFTSYESLAVWATAPLQVRESVFEGPLYDYGGAVWGDVGAEILLEDVEFAEPFDGTALYVNEPDASIVARRITVPEMNGDYAWVTSPAWGTIRIEDSSWSGARLAIWDGASLELERVEILDVDDGAIFAMGNDGDLATLRATDTTVQGPLFWMTVEADVYGETIQAESADGWYSDMACTSCSFTEGVTWSNGVLELRDSTLSGDVDALVAEDAEVLVSGSTLTAGRIGALLDGSTGDLRGNTWSTGEFDVVWQRCDGVEEPLLDEELAVDLCPETDWVY